MNDSKIDHRIHYIIMTDTETCNTICIDGKLDMTNVFIYDMGWQVTDKRGIVYEEKSYFVKEIFFGEKDLMQSAYYANKIPKYMEQIANGERVVKTWKQISFILRKVLEEFDINVVVAHNARFDYSALTATQRYLTKSKYRYFFPYGIEIWDTLKMAKDTICKQKTYIKWATENGYTMKNGTPRATAEILYRYIYFLRFFQVCKDNNRPSF